MNIWNRDSILRILRGSVAQNQKGSAMFAIIGASVFSGAAIFSLVVIVRMVRAYLPAMEAALRHEAIPPALPVRAYVARRRRPTQGSAAGPVRFEPARAAA